MRPSFFHHLHPPTIPARQSRLRYTLGAGGLSVFLAITLAMTGVLELFYYIPTTHEAGASIQIIIFNVPYGDLIRNLHFWAAQLLVLMVTLHMLRVIFTGAYIPPRRLNYWIGMVLLLLTILMDFSGYILRWDEGVLWAVVVGTNLLKSIPGVGAGLYELVIGGTQAGQAALTRFNAWHVFGLVIPFIIFSIWHIFRLRRDGGIAVSPPQTRSDHQRITRTELLSREITAAIIAGVVLLLLAVFFPAPIAPAITDTSPLLATPYAPWFFLWIQQLLKYGDAFWMGVVIPAGVLLFLFLLPVILPAPRPEDLGSWFPRRARLAQVLIALLVLAILVFSLLEIWPGL